MPRFFGRSEGGIKDTIRGGVRHTRMLADTFIGGGEAEGLVAINGHTNGTCPKSQSEYCSKIPPMTQHTKIRNPDLTVRIKVLRSRRCLQILGSSVYGGQVGGR
jgi:hypothetical protein